MCVQRSEGKEGAWTDLTILVTADNVTHTALKYKSQKHCQRAVLGCWELDWSSVIPINLRLMLLAPTILLMRWAVYAIAPDIPHQWHCKRLELHLPTYPYSAASSTLQVASLKLSCHFAAAECNCTRWTPTQCLLLPWCNTRPAVVLHIPLL